MASRQDWIMSIRIKQKDKVKQILVFENDVKVYTLQQRKKPEVKKE